MAENRQKYQKVKKVATLILYKVERRAEVIDMGNFSLIKLCIVDHQLTCFLSFSYRFPKDSQSYKYSLILKLLLFGGI